MIDMKILLALLGLTLTAQTAHQVTISWTDPNNPTGTQYNVYRATGPCTGSPTFAKILGPVSGLIVNDTTIALGAYCYYVTATNGTVESLPSPTAGATVLPFAPTSISITAIK